MSLTLFAFLIVGDFNARHLSWDITGNNRNGMVLFDALADTDLYILNTGEPTRLAERHGDPDTVLDLALANDEVRDRAEWKRSHHMGSDHFLCEVRIRHHLCRPPAPPRKSLYPRNAGNGVWKKIKELTRKAHTPDNFSRANPPTWWNAEVDSAWVNKNRKEIIFERNRNASKEDFNRNRIERNLATAIFKRVAAAAVTAQWDSLCSKANLNTTEFWKFQNRIEKRKAQSRSIMYSDAGTVLLTDEQQGKAFLERFVHQSNHNDKAQGNRTTG